MIIAGILGGAIAYLGNQLGRYIGRKKLSIFRLRPRHTSILITTITGTLIASGTLLFAYLSSQEVRILFNGLKKFQSEVVSQTIKTIEQANIGGVVYKEREPILTAVIDGSHGREAIKEQLKNVLGYTNEAAFSDSKKAAAKMGIVYSPPVDNKLVGYIPEDLDNLADYIDKRRSKVIVMVFSISYAFLGEKFAVGFYPVEYQPEVFSKGEEIASGSIDGTNNKGEIMTNIAKIVIQAKVAALKKGMIENPKTYELIEIDKQYFEDTINKIEKFKRMCKVIVRAKKSVDNRGPLEIYFEVE